MSDGVDPRIEDIEFRSFEVDGVSLTGWVRKADGVALAWLPRPPVLGPAYADEGWIMFVDGRLADIFFSKKGDERGDPNDPPFCWLPLRVS